ncbi:MAG: hypothetical protein HY287_03525 [Planctomycetes bacterium]|nr:hypothetical protein [Planctomycetota bacterium]MBI3833381.1 hypothetical protein [Planctomycetota bacterium]
MVRCEAVSVEGFVQQLAVAYVQHGHWFYVTGEVPKRKDPRAVDAKLIELYGLGLSKWARARSKGAGWASVRYIRHGVFFVLIATKGRHVFYEREPGIRDIRRHPIYYAGYSISYRRGVDRKWHVSVRIAANEYLRLKAYMVGLAARRSVEKLAVEFGEVPFEPYAPVRRQLLNILRAVNRVRHAAGFELVPVSALRFRRRVVKPFSCPEGDGGAVALRVGGEYIGDIDDVNETIRRECA